MKRLFVVAGLVVSCAAVVAFAQSRNFAAPQTIAGKPIETRLPEKSDDKPAFAGQTRAPYRASPPFNVTTLTASLTAPWSMAFLPDGKILVTEKRGTIRILDAKGGDQEYIEDCSVCCRPIGITVVTSGGEVVAIDGRSEDE